MKSIACLIVAIPTLVMATGSAAVGQQFPSTAHGSFDGSVVQIPEATISLPNVGGQNPLNVAPDLELGGSVPTGTRAVGDYQTVMDPSSAVQVPGSVPQLSTGSSSRSIAPSAPSSPRTVTVNGGNEITIQPAEQFNSNQNVIIEQGQTQYFEGVQTYTPTEGEIFIDQENFEGATYESFEPSTTQVGEEYFIEQPQLPAGPTVVNQPRQRVQKQIRQSRRNPGARNGGRAFTTSGASALLMSRNYGDNRNFSTNGANVLSSGNTTFDVLPGVDAFFSRRRVNGLGWEARYFGLYPEDTSTQISGSPTHLLPGLDQLTQYPQITTFPPTISVFNNTAGQLFNGGDPHVLTRQTELHNVEFNLLRNGRSRLRASQTEYLIGFRYLNFGETLLAESIRSGNSFGFGSSPESVGYFSTVENEMLGIQIGARSDYQIGSRLTLHMGLKAGAFNNTVNTRQRVDFRMPDGSVSNPFINSGTLAGNRFDIGAEDEVKSLMLELDAAVSFQLSSATRVRVGYRGLGVTDVAFASDQIGNDFTDATSLLNPNTDGTLVLQGGYVGLEFAY